MPRNARAATSSAIRLKPVVGSELDVRTAVVGGGVDLGLVATVVVVCCVL